MSRFVDLADQRWQGLCAHCGGPTEERDHAVPRVFLDRPLPSYLPVVLACGECNRGASLDEEYVACLLDVVISGSADPELVEREKVRRILKARPLLRERFSDGMSFPGPISKGHLEGRLPATSLGEDRVARVLAKMCRGLAAFDLSERFVGDPDHFEVFTSEMVAPAFVEEFEYGWGLPQSDVIPYELGSIAFQEMIVVSLAGHGSIVDPEWKEVQAGRCRYKVERNLSAALVRLVLSEFLYAYAIWGELEGGV